MGDPTKMGDESLGYPDDLGNNKYTDVTINNNDLPSGYD